MSAENSSKTSTLIVENEEGSGEHALKGLLYTQSDVVIMVLIPNFRDVYSKNPGW